MGITVKDIARELNISPSAVSKALNNKPGIGTDLRLKIQSYAEKMSYKPYIATRKDGMYSEDINIIAIVYPQSIGYHLIRKVQEGIDAVLYKSKFYELRFAVDVDRDLNDMQNRELFLRRVMKTNNLVGVIFAFIDISDKIINFLQKNSIESVLINSHTNFGKCVYIDNVEVAYQVTSKLIKLGRKNIGFMIPDESSSTVWQNRISGYMKALKDNKIRYNPNYIVYENTYTYKNAAIGTANLVRENPEINAIIYSGDIQAFAGIKTLKELNKKIPEEIAVMGFDNMEFDLIIEPSLSSVQQPLMDMGKRGAEILINAIRNKKADPIIEKFDTKIILRKSCLADYEDEQWI